MAETLAQLEQAGQRLHPQRCPPSANRRLSADEVQHVEGRVQVVAALTRRGAWRVLLPRRRSRGVHERSGVMVRRAGQFMESSCDHWEVLPRSQVVRQSQHERPRHILRVGIRSCRRGVRSGARTHAHQVWLRLARERLELRRRGQEGTVGVEKDA
eukprot:scaffold2990_cov239-Pinguiococcus_pyrenoidosus.AAC.4